MFFCVRGYILAFISINVKIRFQIIFFSVADAGGFGFCFNDTLESVSYFFLLIAVKYNLKSIRVKHNQCQNVNILFKV